MLFLGFSIACALSSSLNEMILFARRPGFHRRRADPDRHHHRARAPAEPKQPIGVALFGVAATFAPAIGPTVGGWLTENWSWHYIFYLNVVPGLPRSRIQLLRARQSGRCSSASCASGDWLGIAPMAIGLSWR